MSARLARSSTSASSESLPLAWRSARARRCGRSGPRSPSCRGPVMMRMSSMPRRTASSTTYWMAGLSTTGSISFGCALVAGRNRVPRPAAGMTALRTWVMARRFYSLASGVNERSSPRRSRSRLSRWRITTSSPHGRERRPPPRPAVPPARPPSGKPDGHGHRAGRRRAATPGPPPTHTTAEHQRRHRAAAPDAMPAPVATPLPPRNRRVTGHDVAEHRRQPARHPDGPVARWPGPRRRPAPPWPTSPSSTMAPARRPIVRKVLDAPGLPEPSWVGSRPSRRPTRIAVGNVPSR